MHGLGEVLVEAARSIMRTFRPRGKVMRGMDVSIPIGADTALPAYAALPSGATKAAVVLHEVFGRQPEIDRVVERFARAGYAAVAPDLFGVGPRPLCIARMIIASRTGEGAPIDQTIAARDWLASKANIAREKIGIVGFCITGGVVLAIGGGFGAVSANYGTVPPRPLMEGCAPVIGCYGARDRIFGRFAGELDRTLSELGVEHEVHTFATVGHSLLTDGRHPIAERITRPVLAARYDAVVAEQAWKKIFDFFDRHL